MVALILGSSGRHLPPAQTGPVLEVLEMTEIMRIVERKAMQKDGDEASQKRASAFAETFLLKGRSWEEVADVVGGSLDPIRNLGAHWDRV